jgi:Rx N-terminal domain
MAGVGETLVSAVVHRVCEKLVDLLAEPFDLLWNLKDDVEYVQRKMHVIQAVLRDAEKRSLRKEAEPVRLWLRKLKAAAYDFDDILSDFEASIPHKMARRRDNLRQQVHLFLFVFYFSRRTGQDI